MITHRRHHVRMRRIQYLFSQLIIVLISIILKSSYAATPVVWKTLAQGLEYTQLKNSSLFSLGAIHVFRVDLTHYSLHSIQTNDQNHHFNSMTDLLLANHALIGINGGFFNENYQSLGLRINNNKITNPIKNTPWWGIFYSNGSKAFIVPQREFKFSRAINFAVQSGPRLIIHGNIPSLKPSLANRTALGITADGKLILLATEHYPLETSELAKILRQPEKEGGFNCVNALNLDGGSSTQMVASINNFTLNVTTFSDVADIILVVPKV